MVREGTEQPGAYRSRAFDLIEYSGGGAEACPSSCLWANKARGRLLTELLGKGGVLESGLSERASEEAGS